MPRQAMPGATGARRGRSRSESTRPNSVPGRSISRSVTKRKRQHGDHDAGDPQRGVLKQPKQDQGLHQRAVQQIDAVRQVGRAARTGGVLSAKLCTNAATISGRMPSGIGCTKVHAARNPAAIRALTQAFTRSRWP